jgi:hypothetical protein
MDTIKFQSSDGKVKISRNFDGDYFVAVDAKAYGYRGHANGHVVLGEFKNFAKDIVALPKTRKGQANFSSVSLGDFAITVRSTDSNGHLGVFGSLTTISVDNVDENQKLQFALRFEPSQVELAAHTMREIVG